MYFLIRAGVPPAFSTCARWPSYPPAPCVEPRQHQACSPLFLLVVPAAKGIRKDWQEGNSLVPTVLLCPLHLVAKHMVQGKPRGGGSPTQNCLLQSHSRFCHWTSEGPIFMPVGGHRQLGGTFPLFMGRRPAANAVSKRVSLKSLWRLIFSPPES